MSFLTLMVWEEGLFLSVTLTGSCAPAVRAPGRFLGVLGCEGFFGDRLVEQVDKKTDELVEAETFAEVRLLVRFDMHFMLHVLCRC